MKISNIMLGVAFSCLTISCDDFIEVDQAVYSMMKSLILARKKW